MRLEESLAIKNILEQKQANQRHSFATVLNLGSGDISKLKKSKPWVFDNVFNPFAEKGANIIHADAKSYDGACMICDLRLDNALDFVAETPTPRLFILANVLEHVPNQARREVLDKIARSMDDGDSILITVPNSYPYHPDPIDTMYRPTAVELTELMNLEWDYADIIPCGSFKEEFDRMPLIKKIRKILNPLWFLQTPKKYFSALHRLFFLFKDYKVSIVLGNKLPAIN